MKIIAAIAGFSLCWLIMILYGVLAGELLKKVHARLGGVGFVAGRVGSGIAFAQLFEARYPWPVKVAWPGQYANALKVDFLTPEGSLLVIGVLAARYVAVWGMG